MGLFFFVFGFLEWEMVKDLVCGDEAWPAHDGPWKLWHAWGFVTPFDLIKATRLATLDIISLI